MDAFMAMTIDEARLAAQEGGVPIAAVLVRDGVVLSKGRNRRIQDDDPIMHAEIACLRNLADINLAQGATMYCTSMPCFMCAGAVVQWGVAKFVCSHSEGFIDSRSFLESHGVVVVDLGLEEPKRTIEEFFKKYPEKRLREKPGS